MNTHKVSDDCIVLKSYQASFDVRGWQVWECLLQRCLLSLTFIVLVLFAGCVVIPTPEHTLLAGRGEIDESDIAFLEKGKTTREDVLLRFGEPDLVMHDEHTLIYHWQVAHGYVVLASPYSGDMGPIAKDYLFVLEFDDEGHLIHFEKSGTIWTGVKGHLKRFKRTGTIWKGGT